MDKKGVIVESVKKLLALDLSPSEIVENLREVGIDEDEAREIIALAQGHPLEKKEEEKVKKEPGTALRRVAEELASAQEAAASPAPSPPPRRRPEPGKPKAPPPAPPVPRPPPYTPPARRASTLSRLWEKGILTTVNQRLNEIKQMRDEIEDIINKKTRQIAEAELKKAEVLMESKSKLLSENINHKLEAKEREVTQTIDLKIGELRALSRDLEKKLNAFKEEEKKLQHLAADFKAREDELKELKTSLIREMNAELAKSQAKAQVFLDEAREKLADLDERAEKTLQLEQEVIDGIMRDAQDRIEAMKDESKQALREELEEELAKFEEIRKEFSPEKIREKIRDITDLEARLERKVGEALEARMKEKEKELSQLLATKTKSFAEIQRVFAKTSLQISKLQQEIQATQEKVNAFLQRADKQISENIQLQNDAVEGMLETLRKELEKIRREFDPERARQLQAAQYDLQELKSLRTDLEHLKQTLEARLARLGQGLAGAGLDRLEQVLTHRLDEMVQQRFANREEVFNERMEQKLRDMEALKERLEKELKEEINYERLKSQSEELEIFKEQFINVIDRNINKFNEKIKKFNETVKAMEEQFHLRIQNIDRKIEELDAFEKNFAQEMGLVIDELVKKKS